MKKIIGMVIASLVFCNIGFAAVRLIESKYISQDVKILIVCVDGYKFVFHPGGHANVMPRPSMVQFFEERDGKSLPAKC